MRRRFTDEQIIAMLREYDAGAKTSDPCRKHGMSEATFYKYKAKYGGMTVSDARKLKTLEEENARLKRLLADAMLDNAALKDLATKTTDARCEAAGGARRDGCARSQRASGVPPGQPRPVDLTVPEAQRW